jgi:hypothetical protein
MAGSGSRDWLRENIGIIAVPVDTAINLEEPGVLEHLLSGAQKVELEAGSSGSISVKLTEALR